MSSYVVLARRWRPRNFDALVGQQHVVRALRNAISTGRVPHAFLFSGTRGVGKTTLARILAMRLNCRDTQTPEPCGICASCQEVIAGSHPDVMEIDAASRTKVEQMRELLELAPYAPSSSPYKVFILDEIHMLSTQSFNALLKTLEEPPPHVKFIFATTEPRKIPATILSRCQRHDLKRVTAAPLIGHLEAIMRKEGIPWEAAALEAVVRAADGSVRDGLSLLDQVIAHGNGEVRLEAVQTLLGLTDLEAVERLGEHVLAGRGPEVLEAAERFHAGGVEPVALMRDLLDLVHRRTRDRVTAHPPLSGGPTLEQLQMVYQTFLKGEGEIKVADQPAQALEMVLLRAAYLKPIPDLDQLIASLGSGSGTPGALSVSGSAAGAGGMAGGVGVCGAGIGPSVSTRPLERPPTVLAQAEGVEGVVQPPGTILVTRRSEGREMAGLPGKTADPRPEPMVVDAETLTSWERLLSSATERFPEVARRMRGQLACLFFGVPADGGEVCLRLRVVDACFGTPERMRESLEGMLRELGQSDIRVVVEPPSAASRPETLQERAERAEREFRLRLEQEMGARLDVQRLIKTFSARMIAVEPLGA
ncbi:MAG: DNA polymerase III subunit gamma/tau [Magnetococcales bacterium]|nr:DNA polymerase III subunit gamma/tau [Magnetococcales bacterium]